MVKVFAVTSVLLALLLGGTWYFTHEETVAVQNEEVEQERQIKNEPPPTNAETGGVSGGAENTAEFSCAGGKKMTVVFSNNLAGITLSDGRTMTLFQATSGSGIRYLSSDEKTELRGKGESGYLSENGVMTYADCAVPQAQ